MSCRSSSSWRLSMAETHVTGDSGVQKALLVAMGRLMEQRDLLVEENIRLRAELKEALNG